MSSVNQFGMLYQMGNYTTGNYTYDPYIQYIQTGTAATITVMTNVSYQSYLEQWVFASGTYNLKVPRELTPEEKQKIAEEEKKREEARKRARSLLCSLLTEEQNKQFEKDNAFELQVGDRLYRVRPGARVERLNRSTRNIESYFCIHPPHTYSLPAEDWAIAQKLALETDEKSFLATANETKVAA